MTSCSNLGAIITHIVDDNDKTQNIFHEKKTNKKQKTKHKTHLIINTLLWLNVLLFVFIELETHRNIVVGRDLRRPSNPTALLKKAFSKSPYTVTMSR